MLISTTCRNICLIFAFAFLNAGIVFAQVTDSPQTITVDGQLFEAGSSSDPLLDSSVAMRVQVLNPAKSCILYEEQHTFSTLATNGRFNVQVGSNVGDLAKRTSLDSANAMATVFFNSSTAITGKTSGGGGCSYTPASTDVRHFRFFVTPSTVGSTSQLSPDMRVDSVPQALVAQTLQGLGKDDVFKTSVTSTQAKLDNLLTTNYTNLTDLISGTSTQYLRNASTGTLLPTRPNDPSTPAAGQLWYDTTSNEIKYYNGTTVQAVGAAGAGISSLTAGSGLSGGTITTSGTISIATGGVTNAMLATGIDASKITAGTLPAGVVPTNTDTTKLPLAGGTMTGAITMGAATTFGGFDLLGTGHITMNGQKTITIGRYDSTQQTTLISTLNGANAGATWYNSTTNKLMYWNGSAAFEIAETTGAGGDITAVNTNAGSGLTGGNTSGPITLAINVDNSTIEIATNTVQVKDLGITTAKIADNGITTAKIADNNVTNAKIASMNITKLTQGAGDYFAYMPAGTECATGQVLKWDATTDRWLCDTDVTGVTDHSSLTNLSSDDHTQYARLAGRTSGQTMNGGTLGSANLTLDSTSDVSKGFVLIQPTGGNVGIGTTNPTSALHVVGNMNSTGSLTASAVRTGWNSASGVAVGATSGNGMFQPAANSLAFASDSNERMRIDSSGNIGIGTTAPTDRLTVTGSSTNPISTFTNSYNSDGLYRTLTIARSKGSLAGAGFGGGINFSLWGNGGSIDSTAGIDNAWEVSPNSVANRDSYLSFSAMLDGTAGEKMRITSAGNVGIGTTAPTVSLDLATKTDGVRLPSGTTAQQPTAANGMIRYNTTNNKFEGYENGAWVNMRDPASNSILTSATGSAAVPSIAFTGEADTGFYNSGVNSIGVSAGGAEVFSFNTTGIVSPTTGGANILSGNGTAATPTFSFAGDTDTGWFRPAADSMAASTGGTERMRITSDGNIGIGTTNPASRLHLSTTDSSTSDYRNFWNEIQFTAARTTARGSQTWANSSQASGTTTNLEGQYTQVDVSGAGNVTNVNGYATWGSLSSTGSVNHWTSYSASAPSDTGGGTITNWYGLKINGAGSATNNYSIYTDSAKSYFGGNVGIGVTNPSRPLVVSSANAGPMSLLRSVASGNSPITSQVGAIGFGSSDSTTGAEYLGATIHGVAAESWTAASARGTALAFSTTDIGETTIEERLRIDQNGNVGIGTTAPAVSLDFNTKTDAIRIPAGTTAQQPTAANGMIRYNTTNNKFEGYENGAWVNMRDPASNSIITTATGSAALPSLSFTGETDTGFYNSGTNSIGVSAGGAQIFSFNTSGIVSPTAGGANILSGNGTAATPTYGFAGDTDTGWFSPAANTMAAATSGVERVRIDSNGNMGIGNTNPDSKLKIEQNMAGTPDMLTLFNSDTGYASGTGTAIDFEGGANLSSGRITSMWDANNSNANFAISVRGGGVLNESIRVAGSTNTIRLGGNANGAVQGKVHITDSSTTGNTIQRGLTLLHLDSNSAGASGIGVSLPFYAESTVDGTYPEIGTIAAVLDDATDNSKDSSLRFYTLAANSPTGTNTTTEKMRIDSAGRVGIGTTSPSSTLDVRSTSFSRILVGNDTTADSADLASSSTSGGYLHLRRDATNEWFLQADPTVSNHLHLRSGNLSNSPAMSISTAGNVGIGTTTPTQKLEVSGNGFATIVSNVANTTEYPAYVGSRSRGTIASPTITQNNDVLARFHGRGYDGASYVDSAWIDFIVNGTPGVTDMPGAIRFFTSADGSANPSERMRIDNAGNVGIGTSGPASRLDIRGANAKSGSTEIIGRYFSSDTTDPLVLEITMGNSAVAANRYISLRANEYNVADRSLVLQPIGGNVGIGTTTTPHKLTVEGAGVTYARISSTGADGNAAGINLLGGATNANWSIATNSSLTMGAADSLGFFKNSGTTGAKLVIQDSGNVGIGTTAPASELHVAATNANNPGIRISNDANVSRVFLGDPGGTDQGALKLYDTAGTEQVSILSNGDSYFSGGNVGIGSASPGMRLDVAGSFRNSGAVYMTGLAAGSTGNYLCRDGSNQITSGGSCSTSDIRLKENIAPIENSLEGILSLNGILFDWKQSDKWRGENRQMGLIAQEVQKVFPEAITESKQGVLGLNYESLMGPIVESIKAIYHKVIGQEKQLLSHTRDIASVKTQKVDRAEMEAQLKAKDEKIKELEQRLDKIEKMLKSK